MKTKTFDLWPPRLQVSLCALRMATLSVLSVLRVAFLLVGRCRQFLLTKLSIFLNAAVGVLPPGRQKLLMHFKTSQTYVVLATRHYLVIVYQKAKKLTYHHASATFALSIRTMLAFKTSKSTFRRTRMLSWQQGVMPQKKKLTCLGFCPCLACCKAISTGHAWVVATSSPTGDPLCLAGRMTGLGPGCCAGGRSVCCPPGRSARYDSRHGRGHAGPPGLCLGRDGLLCLWVGIG